MYGVFRAGISLLALTASNAVLAQTTPSTTDTQSIGSRDSSTAAKAEQAVQKDSNAASEDIVVTATKREQTLQNVPVSVSVTSEQTIQRAQIRDLIDLQSVVPSLKVQQFGATGQTNFVIRGFGNGAGNVGIEGSVGVFIDGVYRSRSAASLNDLPEIERIEVLRGPQSTLFGKNVSAGAISIVTKRPQFDFGGRVDLTVGNYGQMVAKATVTGPLSDKVAVRLSATTNERQGFLLNTVTGKKVNDRDRQSFRADVLWNPADRLSVRVIADYNQINEVCCGTIQLFNAPATQFIGAAPPFGLGKAIGNPATKFDRRIAFDQDPLNHIVGKGISAQIDYEADFAKLTSITAYRDQIDSGSQDVDFTGAAISNRVDRTRTKTFTQELRLTSTGQGPFSWQLGGFYDHETLDTRSTINFGRDIRAFADGLSGRFSSAPLIAAYPVLAGQSNLYALEFLQGLRPGGTYFQAGQAISAPFTLTQDSFSIFGQADYKITSKLTVTGGLAYLDDRKRATSNIVLTDPFSATNLQTVLGGGFGRLGALQFFYGNTPNHGPVNFPNATDSGALNGHKVTYLGRATYNLGPVNAYVSYSTGWKSGAFNLSTDSRPTDANGFGRVAQPENVTLYEAGLKSSFHGGYANLAVFKQDIKGFQSNAYTGTGYSLVNAGKESVYGFELDTAYRPIQWLALTGGVTYLEPKYDSFTRAACVTFDTVRCPINPATGQRPPFRDLSGARPAGIARWSLSTSATISHQFSDDFSAFLRGEYDYSSNVQLAETADPRYATYGLNNVNASLGFASAKQKIELLVFVRNLTQSNTLIYAFPTVAQDGSFSGFPNDPRTYGVTVTKRF